MKSNILTALGRAIVENTVAGNDGFFATLFVERLQAEGLDTIAFDIQHPDGITTIRVTAVVTVAEPEVLP